MVRRIVVSAHQAAETQRIDSLGRKEMKHDAIAEGIGRQIIKRLNDYNEEESLDDAEYIPLIKRIIEAITIYSEENNATSEESEALENALFSYTKNLYIELCQRHAIEDNENVTMEEVKEESDEYFDYVYEHEEHPH